MDSSERFEKVNFYVRSTIRDLYKGFDKCHNEDHFDEVVNFGMSTYERDTMYQASLDKGMLIVVLAFHDVGRMINDEIHEVFSQAALERNQYINSLFTKDEIKIMSLAIKEHRSKYTANSMYAAILKDADKVPTSDFNRRLKRVVGYNYDKNKAGGLSTVVVKSLQKLINCDKKVYVPQCECNKEIMNKIITERAGKEYTIDLVSNEALRLFDADK